MPSSARKTPSPKPSPRSTARTVARDSRGVPLGSLPPPVDTTGALAPDSAIEGYLLRALVDRDDFVLRYRATTADEAEVLIEEYWPASLVQRGINGEPEPREAALADLVEAGLEAFVSEARQLASIEHPALVKLGPASRLRGTAYRLRMEPLARTLARQMQERPRPPDERWLRALAEPLLGALDAVHRSGRIHGNLRPGNILLRPDESPVLLDFGAAPIAIARAAPWRAPQPEPAFSAPELQLYGSVPTPAADLYSLAALLWYGSTGELPPKPGAAPSAEPRWEGVMRRHPSLRYSAGWMEAIDAGLSFDAALRPQNVEAFRRLLVERPVLAVVSPVVSAMPAASPASLVAPGPAPVAGPSPKEPDPWADPSWSGLDITTAPARDAADASRPAPLGPLPPMRADDDDREPAWKLDDFASAVLQAPRSSAPMPLSPPQPLPSTPRADDAPWPSSAPRNTLFDAPDPGGSWPPRHATPVRKSRHWPWAVAGALIGGVAMLVFALGLGRVDIDPQIERLARLATRATPDEPLAPTAQNRAAAPADAAAPAREEPVSSRRGVAAIEPRPADAGQPAITGSSTITPVQAGSPPPRGVAGEAAAMAAKAAPARSTPVVEADPASACAPRSNFSLYLCMKTQCERTAWYAHPQCVQLRREDER